MVNKNIGTQRIPDTDDDTVKAVDDSNNVNGETEALTNLNNIATLSSILDSHLS